MAAFKGPSKESRSVQYLTADQILHLLENGDLSEFEDDESVASDAAEEYVNIIENEFEDQSARSSIDDTVVDTVPDECITQDFLHVEKQWSYLTNKKDIQWRRSSKLPSISRDWLPTIEHKSENVQEVLLPIQYFLKYISDSIFRLMSDCTNIYAHQTNMIFEPTNLDEIKTFIGLHVIMGTLGLPRIRLYWDPATQMNIFKENMPLKRFFKLRTALHVVNNLEKPNECKDRLWKVRPVYDSLLNRMKELPLEQKLCVDEQMISFRGKINILQYVKSKPQPWGIKLFLLCGQSGLAYNFIIYQGSTTEFDTELLKKFGQGAAVVLQLAQSIKINNHQLYFDNYFTSYNLLEELFHRNILAIGTVRINRFANPPLLSDKEMKKKSRGFSDQVVSSDSKICLIKWYDNKPVFVASNFCDAEIKDEVERWDKEKKEYIKIPRPEPIKLYNESMGGVDKLDFLINLYKIKTRTRKWPVRMIFHAIDLACTNSWLEYKQDCISEGIHTKDILDLMHFRLRIGETLIKQKKLTNNAKKRGRPGSQSPSSELEKYKVRRTNFEFRPLREIQHDNIDHMPIHTNKPQASRCKQPGCHGKSRWYCDKCKVTLCLQQNRNCFVAFHRS